MKFAYYPGCTLKTSAKEYDMSTREVFSSLGVELLEVEDWNCCGATSAYSVDYLLSLALPARNLAIAEKDRLDVLSPCPECYLRQWKTNKAIKGDEKLMEKVNKALDGTGLEVKGNIDVRHPIDVLVNDIGLDKLSERMVRPLKGLKIAPYYGCVIVKPPRDQRFDSPEKPTTLDKIIETTGATCLFYDAKTKCCGGPLMLANQEVQLRLTYELLKKAEGADCITTACPLCHMALDARQINVEEAYNEKIDIPTLYFTQLIGLALGIPPKRLGLDKNFVSTEKLLESLDIGTK
jgi:heterodisulfide reductase subunit B